MARNGYRRRARGARLRFQVKHADLLTFFAEQQARIAMQLAEQTPERPREGDSYALTVKTGQGTKQYDVAALKATSLGLGG